MASQEISNAISRALAFGKNISIKEDYFQISGKNTNFHV